ncbi:hypothetical protein FOZ62_021882, partial [Perkinsus olseni]
AGGAVPVAVSGVGVQLSSLEYALEREWGISIRDESSPFFCGERTQPKSSEQQQDTKDGAAAASTELPRPPEGARSEDQVDDAAGGEKLLWRFSNFTGYWSDESPLSVVSVGEF